MKIDSKEVSQPPKVNHQSRADKETQSIDSIRAEISARRRRATIPQPTTSGRAPRASDDDMVRRRRAEVPIQLVLEPEPVRKAGQIQIRRLQEEAHRWAESERCGTL